MNLLQSNVLFVPSLRKGNGTGHIKRILAAMTLFTGQKAILAPPHSDNIELQELVHQQPFSSLRFETIDCLPESLCYDACIVDNRNTPLAIMKKIRKACRFLICLDEGGTGRSESDYLIDALYHPGEKRRGNAQISPLLSKTSNAESKKKNSVLVSFGGEDAAGLTEKTLYVLKQKQFRDLNITVVKGPLFRRDIRGGEHVRILHAPETLQEILNTTETVITSYGLTAFESQQAGCRTGLVHPSRYHQKITRRTGFISLGYKQPSAQKITGLLQSPLKPAEKEETPTLNELLGQISVPDQEHGCPGCGNRESTIWERYADRTVYQCRECKMLYLVFWTNKESRYEKSYFFEEYRKQYGKDYLEDFEHIKTMGIRRLQNIHALKGRIDKGSLLDIGCAFGPFLQASAENGWNPIGLDISKEAVKYIREKLKMDALSGNFETMEIPEGWNQSFDCVSLWYVIEHFQDLSTVLQRIHNILKKGGILSFSTPHYGGISSLKDRRAFFAKSPDDHFTVWSRKSARKLLTKKGFKIRKIVITGHHPERFCKKRIPKFMYGIFDLASRILGLGDTFEIYAQNSGTVHE